MPAEYRPRISAAMNAWGAHLRMHAERCDTCEQSNVIRFRFVTGEHGDRFPFEKTTAKVAHVVSSRSNRRAPEVHFNAESFSEQRAPGPDIFVVALHEVGHVLGLAHSADPKSIMYPIYHEGGLILDEEVQSQFIASRFEPPLMEEGQ